MMQHGCGARPSWPAPAWDLAWITLLLLLCRSAHAAGSGAVVPCPGKPRCVQLVVDGTVAAVPPLFRASVTNESINEIVLAGTRYVLRPSSWTVFSQQQPYRLTRNLTIRGTQDSAVMDFSLIEKKVLIGANVTVTMKDLVLVNVRKLGGFALDFFMGEAGSVLVLNDTFRVKPACQLPGDILKAAQSFQRVSPAWPPNAVRLLPKICLTAAISTPEPQQQCYTDALQFDFFSLLAAYNDPDKGSQYPGYVLYQENTTRVCQSTITPECLKETNGDEELCMAMLVAATGASGQPGRAAQGGGGGASAWSPGTVAGIAVSGALFLLLVFLLCVLRRKLVRICMDKRRKKKAVDPELGARPSGDDMLLGPPHLPSYTGGSRAISQQVTLNTLLGAGGFGRVYKGRWHSSDVAIKIITVRSPKELPKVLREAEVMMSLKHPNIVRAFHASVWNPMEQARALKVKAKQEARYSSGSPNVLASGGGNDSSAAAAVDGFANSPQPATRRNEPRDSSNLRRGATAAAAAAAAAARASAYGEHVTTPSISAEQPPTQQQHTSSTFVNTDSGQLAGRSAHASGPAAAAAEAGGAATRGDGGVTGWLQILPTQQPSSRADTARLSTASADCAASMLADVSGRSAQHSAGGTASTSGLAGAAAAGSGPQQRDPAGSDGVQDVSGHHSAAYNKPQQQQQQQQPGAKQEQQPLPQQQLQQQQAGGLRRTLLSGWRGQSSNGTATRSADGDGGTATGSPSATAAAAMAAQASGGTERSLPRSAGSQEGRGSGLSTAAGVGVSVSSGALAIMPAATRQGTLGQGSGASGASSGSRSAGAGDGSVGKKAQPEQQVWIILELCTGGTLLDAALAGRFRPSDAGVPEACSGKVEMARLLSRLLDAAIGMAYLHSKGIMHGDLKAGNVLLQHTIHGSYGEISKISDFGLSAVLINGTTHRSTASLGTITHMAPELLRNGRMSPSADVYSFGILMWEVFCGKQAWQGLHYGVVVERVVVQEERPPVPQDMPEELELLMRRCWDPDPTKRPSFDQIVECLELLLDNLGSEDEDTGSQASDQGQQPAERGCRTPTVPPDHRLQQQQQLQAAVEDRQLEDFGRLSALAALPAAAAAAGVLGGAAAAAAAAGEASAQPPALPAARLAAAFLSAHTSPSTPVRLLQSSQQQPGTYDSAPTLSGGMLPGGGNAGASQPAVAHSSSSAYVRSSGSGLPHGSQAGAGASGGRRPSVLDENFYLQDL